MKLSIKLFRSCVSILGIFLISLGSGLSIAQEEESRFANAKTTKVKALSPATAKKIEPVRELLAPEVPEGQQPPEPNAQGALRELNRIGTDSLPSHEKAEIWNLYGYVYYLLDDQRQARTYYTRVLNEREANTPLVNRTLKTVAQLCMIDEDWDCAMQRMKQWMGLQEVVGAPDHALLAQIYYSKDDMGNALRSIETAIEMREATGKVGQENWYSIQRSIYYGRKDYRKVITILDKLIANYPNVRYWRELGGMYSELEDSDKQMNAYAVAHLQDGLQTEAQLVGLAYMYIGADAPFKGAEIVVEGMNAGTISRSEKHLQLVGSAYYQARELEKALPFMEEAAGKATSGEPFGRLAGIYLDMERFDDSIRTGREALRRGRLNQPALVQLGLGTALFNKKQYDDAISEMRKVKGNDRQQASAQDWIKYINAEKRREQQLRDSGINLAEVLGS